MASASQEAARRYIGQRSGSAGAGGGAREAARRFLSQRPARDQAVARSDAQQAQTAATRDYDLQLFRQAQRMGNTAEERQAALDQLRAASGKRDFQQESRASAVASVVAETPLLNANAIAAPYLSDRRRRQAEAFLTSYGAAGVGTADAIARRAESAIGIERPEGDVLHPVNYLNAARQELQQTNPVVSGAGNAAGYISDPVWLATYGRGRAALAARDGSQVARAGRWGIDVADDIIAGAAADLARGLIRSGDPTDIKNEMAMGAGAGAALGLAGRLVSKGFPSTRTGDTLDDARASIRQAFRDSDYDAYLGREAAAAKARQVAYGEQRADHILEETRLREGDQIALPEMAEGMRRFTRRQRRVLAAQTSPKTPEAPRRAPRSQEATRAALRRLEEENAEGRVLLEPERMQEARASMLNEQDVAEEVEALLEMGLSRSEAEKIAVPEFTLTEGPGFKTVTTFSGFDPTLLARPIQDAIKAGKWLKGHAVAGARWLAAQADGFKSMRQAAQALQSQFGRGIRRFVPEIWERFGQLTKRVETAGRTFDEPTTLKRAIDRAAKVSRGTADRWNHLTQPVVDRVRRASPQLSRRLYGYTSEFHRRTHNIRTRIDPLVSRTMKSMDKGQHLRFKSALLNQDFDGAQIVARELSPKGRAAAENMLREARATLDQLYREAQEVGMDVAYLDQFWPRAIKRGQVGALRKALSGREVSQIDDALREAAKDYGGRIDAIPDDVQRSVIAKALTGTGPRPLDAARPRQFKQRRVKAIPDNLLHFYENPHTSLDNYIERVSEKIARRRLFGGTKSPDDINLQDSIADLVHSLGLEGKQADDVKGILDSLFRTADQQVGAVTDALRNVGYAATIGQFTSTLRQAGDLTSTVVTRGWYDTGVGLVKALSGKTDISLSDLGLNRIHEELASRTRSGKALDYLLSGTGFRQMDAAMKNVHLAATLNRAQRAIRNPKSKLGREIIGEIRAEYGADADQLLRDLAAGEKSDLALTYMMSRLGEIQPVTRLEVPQGYLDARGQFGGAPLLLYQLKTFSLRRLGLIRRLALDEIVDGSKMIRSGDRRAGLKKAGKGVARLGYILGLITVSDGGITMAQDWLTGKEMDPAGAGTDAALQVLGLNRYAIDSTKRGQFIQNLTFPPALSIIQRTLADLFLSEKELRDKTSLRLIPGFGNIVYGRYGGGREKPSRGAAAARRRQLGLPSPEDFRPPRPPRPERPTF
jgi:hypothetical protein